MALQKTINYNDLKEIMLFFFQCGKDLDLDFDTLFDEFTKTAKESGAYTPAWYTEQEMLQYLKGLKYSDGIAKDLARDYAKNMQLAYDKGISVEKNRSNPKSY